MVGAKITEGTLGKSGEKPLNQVRWEIERIYGYRNSQKRVINQN
jgi:hypothetical protein